MKVRIKMSTTLELPKIEYPQNVSSPKCFDLDHLFSLDSRVDLSDFELKRRIDVHKLMVSEAISRDIGYIAGVIGYFIDNPSHLPILLDQTDGTEAHHHCRYRQFIEATLLPIAVSQHRWLMGNDLLRPVSSNEAWLDFKRSGHYDEWRIREEAATPICLCPNAEHCIDCNHSYKELQSRKNQGLPLIPVVPQRKDYIGFGLTSLVSILEK